ncbi:MAG TPA: peptidoglycan-binding protein [Deltaproteobacteria bacterium]|nr:peptidoglycan-binding protein [Deltaproteobacteria bacterium]
MPQVLRRGSKGPEVKELQRLLTQRGYPVDKDGDFGDQTWRAVRAFQAQNLDQHGQPLKIDGEVGPLTWWSLTHPKPSIEAVSAVDYAVMPPARAGGSALGRAALKTAISEMVSGAREIGGDNRGRFVRKYLAPAGLDEGESWCASFVSWCYLSSCGMDVSRMPFPFCPGAREMLRQFRRRGMAHPPRSGYDPRPGDIVVWWRERLEGWKGHVGLVHQLRDGMLYTIEGNRSSRVQGFSYVFSRMDKLLGFGHVPD